MNTEERKVMQAALAYVRWQAFGEFQTADWDGLPRIAAEVDALLVAALAQPASAAVPQFKPGESKELNDIHAVIMHIGGDWPEVEGDPYTLFHVKRMARELQAEKDEVELKVLCIQGMREQADKLAAERDSLQGRIAALLDELESQQPASKPLTDEQIKALWVHPVFLIDDALKFAPS